MPVSICNINFAGGWDGNHNGIDVLVIVLNLCVCNFLYELTTVYLLFCVATLS